MVYYILRWKTYYLGMHTPIWNKFYEHILYYRNEKSIQQFW